MKNKFLPIERVLLSALLILLMVAGGKVNAQTYTPASLTSDANEARTVGVIPYSEEFTTYEEVLERDYAITSFRMIDAATVAVLTGASDMILVYSLNQNQILYKIQLPISARAFEYDNHLFHVIGDRTYLTIDSEGRIRERKDFQQPHLPNEELFIITDLKVIDGQPVIHECNANTYSITTDGLQKIDTFYCDHARGCKIHPKYIDENSFTLYNETPSKSGRLNISMASLGLEGKLSCLDYISVDDDFIAINLQTTYNCTGSFVKSYLLVVNSNGDLINLVEVPINFLSYIHKPFLYWDNAWYYAFSGQEGISFFKIDTNTNMLASPDSYEPSDENIDYFHREQEIGISGEETNNNEPTRGNWRTITQAWENAAAYCNLDWTPISSNVSASCTWVGGSGYITTPITSYGYTETGVPYKWGGYTSWRNYESLASQGKYTGNRVTTSSCGGNAYSSDADTYVIGVDCSGYVSRCWEVAHKTTSSIPNICTSQGLVTSASSSAFQNMDALNKSGNHVMLYRSHNGSNQVVVFESSANDWKTSGRTYNISYFSGYYIQRLNYMKYIILRLNSAITLSQNGSTVTNVTQGEPLTVNYSVKNFGSENWTGYVSLWIKQSNGTLMCIQNNSLTTLNANGSASFTFSNDGVSSPVGTTYFYVKVTNYDAGDFGEAYAVGEGSYENPLEFEIVEPGPGGGEICKDCPDYDEVWNLLNINVGVWSTKSSSIVSGGCHVYKVALLPNSTYTFQTCDPGTATFDTQLHLYNANCNFIDEDDDGCTGRLSSLVYTTGSNAALYYLIVDGYSSASGSFTIAAKREDTSTSYVINASANPSAGGTVSGAGTYQSGSTCTLTASPNTGYGFVRWTKDGTQVSTNSTYSFTVTENASYVASFGVYSYTISASASPSSGGSVSGEGSYNYGSTCTLTASPATGYSFVRWTKNGSQVSTNASYSFTVTGNASYVAEFSQNSYTISASASPSNGGSVSGSGTYNYGSTCTLTASPATGYSFVRWTKNGSQVSTSSSYSFTVTESASYVAVFSQNSYTISASANPSAGGTVSGGGTYQQGQSCTLTASANTGYTFTNWTENGTVVSTNVTYNFTVTGNRTLVANFEEQPQTTNHYSPVSQGTSGSMVLTGKIQINGVDQMSDQLELGVFCGNECRGSSIAHLFTYTQPNYYMVDPMVYGDSGDSFTFKLYDHSIGQELNYTSPDAITFNDNGYGSAYTPYVLNFVSSVSHTQSLASGWNWWSTYIEMDGVDGLEMLKNSLGDACVRIQSRNQYLDNYTTFWYGTLTQITNEQSYRIRTNTDCTATLVGMAATPSSHPITINNGWNWLGFPCSQNVSLGTAIGNFSPEVNDQVKSRHQYATYLGNNNWYGTLNTLEPGQGYMYKSNASGTKTLTYQVGRNENFVANITTEGNFFTPVCENYADNMTLTAVVECEYTELRTEDYELAVFVGNECRGSVKLLYVEPIDRYVAFLLAYGEVEEDMHFVLTDGTEAVLSDDVIRFAADGTVGTITDPVVLHFGTLGMNDKPQAIVNVFPNPSKNIFNVEGNSIRKVEVIDAWGQIILSKETKDIHVQVNLSGKAAGIYLLRVITDNGIITHQLIKE